jgi:hypothetical protein
VVTKFIGAGAVCWLLVACATTPRNPVPTTAEIQPQSRATVPYVIATLDHADLTFSDGHRETCEVAQDGSIATASGSDYVRGLSKEAFEALLRRRFPGVSKIEVVEYRPDEITVLGEVFHQIHTSMGGGPMRVMDGIAAANGFTPLANKRRVKLVRQNAGNVEVYELDLREMMRGEAISQNLLLRPGDVISVPRNFL